MVVLSSFFSSAQEGGVGGSGVSVGVGEVSRNWWMSGSSLRPMVLLSSFGSSAQDWGLGLWVRVAMGYGVGV